MYKNLRPSEDIKILTTDVTHIKNNEYEVIIVADHSGKTGLLKHVIKAEYDSSSNSVKVVSYNLYNEDITPKPVIQTSDIAMTAWENWLNDNIATISIP